MAQQNRVESLAEILSDLVRQLEKQPSRSGRYSLTRRRVPNQREVGVRAIVLLDDKTVEVVTKPDQLQSPSLTQAEEDILVAGGADESVLRQGAVLRAMVEKQSRNAYEALLASSLTVSDAAKSLGVNPSRIRQRLEAGTLYGIKEGHTWRLPRFQFARRGKAAKGTVPNVDKVISRIPRGVSPLTIEQWFNTPNPDLHSRDNEERPMTPLEWLSRGESPEVAGELAAQL
jgi:hypothetical protein